MQGHGYGEKNDEEKKSGEEKNRGDRWSSKGSRYANWAMAGWKEPKFVGSGFLFPAYQAVLHSANQIGHLVGVGSGVSTA